MADSNGRNGNGILASVATVAAFVVGIVIGVYANQANAADRYVTKAQYDSDQGRLERQLTRIEEQLAELLNRGGGR